MTEPTRKALSELSQANEKAIADAEDLKTGAESPVDRVERLDAEQHQIEADLATDWMQRRREQLDSGETR